MNLKEKIRLRFPDSFFKEEVRCDYLVTEKQKKIWAVELDLLNELLRVCKKYDIKVIVYAGTMLGAIRHKGMIPWDDDIDVALERSEYEKLLNVAEKEFMHPYFFQTGLTDRGVFLGYARLRNSLTTGYVLSAPAKGYNQGIYIDIFILDGYVGSKSKAKTFMIKRRICEYVLNLYNGPLFGKNLLMTTIRHILFYSICQIVPYERMCSCYNNVVCKYNGKSDILTLMTHSKYFIDRYKVKVRELSNIVYVPYENIMVPVPAMYDDILARTYGEYMVFPPLEKRGIWHEGEIEFDPDTPYTEYLERRNEELH